MIKTNTEFKKINVPIQIIITDLLFLYVYQSLFITLCKLNLYTANYKYKQIAFR